MSKRIDRLFQMIEKYGETKQVIADFLSTERSLWEESSPEPAPYQKTDAEFLRELGIEGMDND